MTPEERDDLSRALRAGYRSMIVEADEWRPLADHVDAWVRAAVAEEREACAEVAWHIEPGLMYVGCLSDGKGSCMTACHKHIHDTIRARTP